MHCMTGTGKKCFAHSIYISINCLPTICVKQAVLMKYWVKGRDNPWLSDHRTRTGNSQADWQSIRALGNKCTVLKRKCKSSFYYETTKENLNNTINFWKAIKYRHSKTCFPAVPLKLSSDFQVTDILSSDSKVTG